MNNEPSYFELVSAGGDHRVRRPMSDLVALNQTLDEIEARANAREVELDFKEVWKNYNDGGKGTPTNATAHPAQKIDAKEVARRLARP